MFGALCFGQAMFAGIAVQVIYPAVPSGLPGTTSPVAGE